MQWFYSLSIFVITIFKHNFQKIFYRILFIIYLEWQMCSVMIDFIYCIAYYALYTFITTNKKVTVLIKLFALELNPRLTKWYQQAKVLCSLRRQLSHMRTNSVSSKNMYDPAKEEYIEQEIIVTKRISEGIPSMFEHAVEWLSRNERW